MAPKTGQRSPLCHFPYRKASPGREIALVLGAGTHTRILSENTQCCNNGFDSLLHLILKSIPNRAERITVLNCKWNRVNQLKFITAHSALKTWRCYAITLCCFVFSFLLLHEEPNHAHLGAVYSNQEQFLVIPSTGSCFLQP